jgi:hypothetical protein
MVDLDNIDLKGPPFRTKAHVDQGVLELAYERRLSMAARRAADLFDVSMHSTASLLRELAPRGGLRGERCIGLAGAGLVPRALRNDLPYLPSSATPSGLFCTHGGEQVVLDGRLA